MKPIQIIKDYLTFSRGEQRGIAVLLLVLLVINIIRISLPREKTMRAVDFSAFQQEITAFEEELNHSRSKQGEQIPAKPPQERYKGTVVHDSGEVWKAPQTTVPLIELNTADTFDLQRLRGIGPSFARRITGYRARLGGFISKEQLLEVYGMDSSRYEMIEKYVRVDPTRVVPVNLNTCTFKELICHPYMPYEVAKEIALFRKRHKRLDSLERLRDFKTMTDSLYHRLVPYLSLDGRSSR